jgi:hypothetical protein
MNREELAQTLYTQEQLQGLTGKAAEDRQALLDQLVEEHGLTKAQQMIKEKGFKELTDQAGIQTQFNQKMEELKEILAEGILPAFVSIGGWLAENMGIVKAIAAVYLGMKVTLGTLNALNMVSLAIDKKKKKTSEKEAGVNIIGSAAKIGGSFGPLGIAVAAGIVATGLASLAMFLGDDIMSPGGSSSGYGNRTLFGPEGAIQLNNKDTVIAGTNLFDKADDMVSAPAGAVKVSPSSGGNAEVVNAINNLKQSVAALASRPVNVSIDGQKVIKATTGANPNTDGDEMRKNSYKLQ